MSVLKQILLFSLLLVSSFYLLFLFILPTNHQNQHHQFPLFSSPLSNPFPPPPKLAYFITGTQNDGPRMFRLLRAIYHPRNYYLLHIDQVARVKQRHQLAEMVASIPVFAAAENVRVVEKANPVHEEGSSPLALVLHGAAILLRWKKDWDWFLNLAASDYPLIPQDDFLHILSFLTRDLNFIEHHTNISTMEYDRITDIIVDPRLYLQSTGRMFMGNQKRSPHVILTHKFVEYVILGWENLPRKLLLYLSNARRSHEVYFQTLACSSREFSHSVVNSNLRFIECRYPCIGQNTRPLDFKRMLGTGAAFVGNIPTGDPVLDMIDSVVLNRGRAMVTPGGWCLGRPWFGGDSCLQWGDLNILRPGPAAKRFEKLLLNLIRNTTIGSSLLDYGRPLTATFDLAE